MLLQVQQSQVLLIDIQSKLAPAIADHAQLSQAAAWVLQIARLCDVPVMATEHYPAGLGHTIPLLLELLPNGAVHEKIHFSAMREPEIVAAVAAQQRPQVVVLGTEAHVCVLQTVLDLLAAGYQVYLVSEAVGSRTPENKQLALSRMQQAGAVVISKEMLAFEWLERAGTELFRQISKGWIK